MLKSLLNCDNKHRIFKRCCRENYLYPFLMNKKISYSIQTVNMLKSGLLLPEKAELPLRRQEGNMSKKKNGRIAVPFLITIFVGLFIIGGAALFLYNYFEIGKEDELKEPVARASSAASYEDSHTILLILDTPEVQRSSTFVLMRSVPKDKKLLFVGIPTNSITVMDDRQTSLSEAYERGGADSAVSFTENIFGVEIDRYMTFDEAAFLKVCDIFGGVSYAVGNDVDIIGIDEDAGEQLLNGEQILKLVTYPFFSDGEEERAYITSSLLSSMVNQADGKRIADGLDRSFTSVINLVDSDVTAVDYKNRKTGIKYMLENGTSIARFRIVTGTAASGDYIVDKSFGEEMAAEYFTEHTNEED